jgi:hypothetical protein
MSPREQQFARRRTELQLQCAAQRAAFTQSAEEMQASVHGLNHGFDVVGGSRLMPMLLAAVSAAGVLSRAGGVARLLGRAWMIWQTVQRLRRSMK